MTRLIPDRLIPIIQPGSRSSLGSDLLINRLKDNGTKWARAAAALLYPPHCMSCGVALDHQSNGVVCLACAAKIKWIGNDCCKRCGDRVGEGRGRVEVCPTCQQRPPAFVKGSAAVAEYGGPLRAIILGLKFGGSLQAAPLLGRLLGERLRVTGMVEAAAEQTVLVPVPLARSDFALRGFNQAEEIALGIARHTGATVVADLLKKVKPTPPQAKLDREARRENLQGVFVANRRKANRFSSCRTILIDDVMTTGATVSECARVLHEVGVSNVFVGVTARG